MNFAYQYYSLGPESKAKLTKLFEHVRLIVIDEMSMVSADLLYNVHRRLQDIMNFNEPFGGLPVMLVGDLLQLKPVRGAQIFDKPTKPNNKSLFNSEKYNLWENFTVVSLTTNKRQGEVSVWTKCLDNVRLGFDALTKSDIELIESRKLSNYVNQVNLELDDAMHLFYTNAAVKTYNDEHLKKLPGNLETNKAIKIHPKGYHPTVSYKTGTVDDTGFLDLLELKKNARVMLIYNISVADSLVNGILGTILDIIICANSREISAVIVKFDDPNAGMNQRKNNGNLAHKFENQNGTPIFCQSLEYSPTNKKKFGHSLKCRIVQFPLKLAWAATAHKMQGSTIPPGSNLVIHGHKHMPSSMAYVMMSRVSDINNLFIDEEFQCNKIQTDKLAMQENNKLSEKSITNQLLAIKWDIFYVNIRSFHAHWEDLEKDINAINAEILILSETWLDQTKKKYSIFEKMEIFSVNTKNHKGKGVAILVKKDGRDNITIEHKSSFETFQLISFQYLKKHFVTCVYASQKCKMSKLIEEIERINETIGSQYRNKIVIGDFNTNSIQKELINKLKLKRIVNQPTHEKGGHIDHLYVLHHEAIESLKINYPCYTDHASFSLKLK